MELDESINDNLTFRDETEVTVKEGNILIGIKNGVHQFNSYPMYTICLTWKVIYNLFGRFLEKGYNIHWKYNVLSIGNNSSKYL